jgi:hypothetical protein
MKARLLKQRCKSKVLLVRVVEGEQLFFKKILKLWHHILNLKNSTIHVCLFSTDIPWRLNKQWLKLAASSATHLIVPLCQRQPQRSRKMMSHQPLAKPLDWRGNTYNELLLGNESVRFN